MRIILINLQRATERRTAMERQLHELGLKWERLEATDCHALSPQDMAEVDAAVQARRGVDVSLGEIGCWLSHRRAHELIANGDDPHALVLEDDVELEPDLLEVLRLIDAGVAGSFDVIRLHRGKPWRRYVPVRRLDEKWTLGFVRPVDPGTLACVISRNAARQHIARVPKMVYLADWALSSHRGNGLMVCSLDPPVVHHADGGSSLIKESGERISQSSAGRLMHRLRHRWTHLREEYERWTSFYKLVKLGRRGQLTGCAEQSN